MARPKRAKTGTTKTGTTKASTAKAPGESRPPRRAAPRKKLVEYARKRDFARTPEPKPQAAGNAAGEFVVQKHAARRLHYDLRLELDGVLKSWAVTRGPSLTLGEKRLAVRTEDHPIEYLDFEGNIPKGEYGGGSMIVWDRGRWTPVGDPHKGLAKGHLEFTLDGARLKGRWHLVRMKPQAAARSPSRGCSSRRRMNSPATPATPRSPTKRRPRASAGKPTRSLPPPVRCATTTRRARVPASAARCCCPTSARSPARAKACCRRSSSRASPRRATSRPADRTGFTRSSTTAIASRPVSTATRCGSSPGNGLDWTARFRGIADALAELGLGSALIDGEIVVEDEAGITNLSHLQADLQAGRRDRFRYFTFDLLYCDGYDLTKARLVDRKELLAQIIAVLPPTSPIRFSEHLEADGPTMLAHTCRLGLEGIVSKRKDLPYRPGRGHHWFKAKCMQSQEFVILGYVASTAATGAIGSLALGYHADGKLTYAGRVGTGWSEALRKIAAQGARQDQGAEAGARQRRCPPAPKKAWCGSNRGSSATVEYRDWTRDGLIRNSSFKGLREDKPATEITLEMPQQSSKAPRSKARAAAPAVKLTHPERILWEEPGITKQGLADFYTDIADWILPHITGRVLSLLRCPSGTSAKCFFAKHPWAGLAKEVERVDVGVDEPMIAIDDLDGLLNLVQASVVEIHPWGSRVDRLDEPDRLIFDLDPGEDVPWSAVIAAAREVRDRLDGLGLEELRQDHRRQGAPCHAADHTRRRLGRGQGVHQIDRRGNGESGARPLCRDARQEGPARTDSHRLPAQRPRLDRGRRLFDARLCAGDGVDPAHLGRAYRTHPLRSLHRRQSAQTAPVPRP